MANIFQVQGFGALSEWNGQFASASAAQAFQTIASLGSNSVELTARIWTQSGSTTAVFAHPGKTESDASLLAGFQAAHAAGLSVVFRAGISALDGTPGFGLAPTDVGSFFASYTAEIVRLATIAQAGGVATFAIGNEMSSLSGQPYRGYWTDLISAVREVYQGELTYAAATDEALKVSFWDQLDLIGVNTYPPLTSSTTPTVQELVQAWSEVPFNPYYAAAFGNQSPVDFLHSLSQQYGLQVLMTEVGYRSVDGAAIRPGSWTTVGAADTGEQADAFSAFFQVWTAHGGSWMRGVELWQWDLNNQYSSTGYSVMGKPAEAVVSQYFHGDGFAPGLTVTGSPGADSFDLGRGNDAINAGLGDDVILGGAGNDVITAGPGAAERLSTTTITVTGYGSVVGGVGAQTRVSVNGSPVSALFEFRPAADASAYQTMTVTFDNPDAITSFGIELFNATPGRALHIKGLSINGVVLGPEDGVNASAPGSFDLYVRAIQFDATDHQEWFFGASTDNDTIDGGAGNDTIASGIGNDMITAGIGNDVVDGGEGMDWAIFAGNIADYDIDFVDSRISVVDRTAGRDGSDDVANVEFLKFADATVSVLHMTPGPGLPGGGPPPGGTGGAGDVTNQTIRHDDDSGITGHTSEHDVTDRNGSTTSIERFFADDDLAFRQLVNGNGSVERADYDDGGHLGRFATSYADGSFDQFTFSAPAPQTGETLRHADDSRDSYTTEFSNLSVAVVGHDALIDLSHDACITLLDIITPLTPHDVLIV